MRRPMHATAGMAEMRELFAGGSEAERRRMPLQDVLADRAERRAARRRQRDLALEQRADLMMTRRGLLAGGAVAVGAGLLGAKLLSGSGGDSSAAAPVGSGAGRHGPRVVIVGAGLAGLRCADLLWQKRRIAADVYEADETHIGGRCWSLRGFFSNGLIGEHGGAFIDTSQVAIRRLAAELGLHEQLINGGDLRRGVDVYWVNGARYTHQQAVADWHDFGHDVFRAAYHRAPWPQRWNRHTAGGVRLDRMNVPEWLDTTGIGAGSRFGQLMQSNVLSEYGGDPSDQPALNLLYLMAWNGNSLDPLAGDDEAHHIVGGNDQIVTGLVNRLPAGTVRQGMQLEAVRANGDGTTTCTFKSGSSATDVVADRLVLALPFSTLRFVDLTKAGLSRRKLAAITELGMGQNAKIHVEVGHKTWPALGYAGGSYTSPDGYQCAWDDSAALGAKAAPAILLGFPGGSVARDQLTGAAHGPAPQADVDWFLGQVDNIYPGTAGVATGKAWEDHWSRDPWHLGAYSYWRVGQYTTISGYEGTPEGSIHFAGEHTASEQQGYMNGAITTGQRAAGEVLQAV